MSVNKLNDLSCTTPLAYIIEYECSLGSSIDGCYGTSLPVCISVEFYLNARRIPTFHSFFFVPLAYTFNGNWYMWAGAGTFANALAASAARTYNGMSGHLVTITSVDEFNFLSSKNMTMGYIAASDQNTEGVYTWMAGPENGTVVSPAFWNTGQPANSSAALDCVEASSPRWNVIACTTISNWYIEFECAPSNLTNATCPTSMS